MGPGRKPRRPVFSERGSITKEYVESNLNVTVIQKFIITVEDSPPFGGRGIPFYLSQFVSILGNLYPDRGIKGSFLGMFGKMDLCKKILIQAYTSLI